MGTEKVYPVLMIAWVLMPFKYSIHYSTVYENPAGFTYRKPIDWSEIGLFWNRRKKPFYITLQPFTAIVFVIGKLFNTFLIHPLSDLTQCGRGSTSILRYPQFPLSLHCMYFVSFNIIHINEIPNHQKW